MLDNSHSTGTAPESEAREGTGTAVLNLGGPHDNIGPETARLLADLATRLRGPYASSARSYSERGWSPLPLPERAKAEPPKGFTGHHGAWATAGQIEVWCKERPTGNVGIRTPRIVIGVDVDQYGPKRGGETIAEYEERWGKLPETFRSSAREWPSGIRWYRVTEGFTARTILGKPKVGGVEIVQFHHRYGAAPPSMHPDTGDVYEWYDLNGQPCDIPHVDDLPELPEAWQHGLYQDPAEAVHVTDEGVFAFYASAEEPHGAMCSRMAAATHSWKRKFAQQEYENRHDAGLRAVLDVLHLIAEGHTGSEKTLEIIHDAYLEAKTTRSPVRDLQVSEGDWCRIRNGRRGVGIVTHKLETGELVRPDGPCHQRKITAWQKFMGECGTVSADDASALDGTAGEGASSGSGTGETTAEEPKADTEQGEGRTAPPDWWKHEPETVQQQLRYLLARDRADELYREYKRGDASGEELFEVTDWDTIKEESSPSLILGGLCYQRGTWWISGAGGSGKTWLAFWTLAELVRQGHIVALYECESGPAMIKGRLLNLGLTTDQIKAGVRDYRSRDGNTVTDLTRHGQHLAERMSADGVAAALFDAAAPLLSASDLDEDKANDIRRWITRALRPVTDDLGALAMVIDHTGHTEKQRPRGSSDKKPANDFMTLVETRQAFAIGRDGQLKLTCTKDRWGRIGENATCAVNVATGPGEGLSFLPLGWNTPAAAPDLAEALDGVEDGTEKAVLACLGMRNEPCAVHEIVAATKGSEGAIRGALRRLQGNHRVREAGTTTGQSGRSVKTYEIVTDGYFKADVSDFL